MRNLTMGRRTALGLLAAPALIRPAAAQSGPIRIGVPTAMTGTWAVLGAQVVRTCRLWARTVNAEGGLLGRPVEFLFEDTQGVPANCLRKAQEMVERDRVNILLGLMASSEARGMECAVHLLSEWCWIHHRRTLGAECVPRQYLWPHGGAGLGIMAAGCTADGIFLIVA